MTEFLGLTFELQVILVAGYLAYKVSSIGSGVTDRTEDLVLKVLTFGLLGKLTADLAMHVIVPASNAWVPKTIWTTTARPAWMIAILVVAFALIIGMLWRRWGSSLASAFMERTETYRDDHRGSVWMSIANAQANWNHVHVHLEGGRCLEGFVADMPKVLPTKPFLINEDGFALYVTSEYLDGATAPGDSLLQNDKTSTLTYVSRDRILRLDVGWQKKRR